VLFINRGQFYKLYWNIGNGTNMKDKLVVLWGLLLFAKHVKLSSLSIFGNSKVAIDWVRYGFPIKTSPLTH